MRTHIVVLISIVMLGVFFIGSVPDQADASPKIYKSKKTAGQVLRKAFENHQAKKVLYTTWIPDKSLVRRYVCSISANAKYLVPYDDPNVSIYPETLSNYGDSDLPPGKPGGFC